MRPIEALKEKVKAAQDKRAAIVSKYSKQNKAKKLTDSEKINLIMEYLGINLDKEE